VHAGLRPEYSVARNLELADEDVFLWERAHINAPAVQLGEDRRLRPHAVPFPMDQPRLINIDTGCVYADRPGLGTLTAVILPEREFVSVPFSG
jgi:serine/threonine protein phosphatase 1